MTQGPRDLQGFLRTMTPKDWIIVGGGLGAFVFSFFPYVGVAFYSVDAWQSYAVLGLLLLIGSAVAWALLQIVRITPMPKLPTSLARILVAACALGTFLIFLRAVTYADYSGHVIGIQAGGILLILDGLAMVGGAIWVDRTASAGTPPG